MNFIIISVLFLMSFTSYAGEIPQELSKLKEEICRPSSEDGGKALDYFKVYKSEGRFLLVLKYAGGSEQPSLPLKYVTFTGGYWVFQNPTEPGYFLKINGVTGWNESLTIGDAAYVGGCETKYE